jgi:hypothetical protein
MPVEPTRRCPYCAEEIQSKAIRCKHCRADLTAKGRSTTQFLPVAALIVLGTAAVVFSYSWIQQHPYPLRFLSTPDPETGGRDVRLVAAIPDPVSRTLDSTEIAANVKRTINRGVEHRIAQQMNQERSRLARNAQHAQRAGKPADPNATEAALARDEEALRANTPTVDTVQLSKSDDLDFTAAAHYTNGSTEIYDVRFTDNGTKMLIEPRSRANHVLAPAPLTSAHAAQLEGLPGH